MSDLSEEYEFSQYKELNQLDKKNKVVVVQDIRDNRIWVQKNIEKRSLPVCEKMLGKKYSNLIYLHKIIKYQNNYYVLEEYINGENIQTIVSQKGKMDLETVRKIIVKICDGLTVLHKNGIIHRDITAKNIIIGVDGNGLEAQVVAGPEDPHGDLAPVGDQDLLECLAHISFLLLSAGRRESFGSA